MKDNTDVTDKMIEDLLDATGFEMVLIKDVKDKSRKVGLYAQIGGVIVNTTEEAYAFLLGFKTGMEKSSQVTSILLSKLGVSAASMKEMVDKMKVQNN